MLYIYIYIYTQTGYLKIYLGLSIDFLGNDISAKRKIILISYTFETFSKHLRIEYFSRWEKVQNPFIRECQSSGIHKSISDYQFKTIKYC